MPKRTALVAHPFPIVVEALATVAIAAGFSVTRAVDRVTAARALAASPDLALVAASLGSEVSFAGSIDTTLVPIADRQSDGAIALTEPMSGIVARIAALAGARTPLLPGLTPRERDVARLVTAGQRNRAIAATLGISEGTVKMHLHNVYAKLGLESRTQLAMSTRA
jgi:DNA-binding CsgD family transcriptional regulator